MKLRKNILVLVACIATLAMCASCDKDDNDSSANIFTQRIYLDFVTPEGNKLLDANAFADYGLIFGAFGLPELGVQGAAIATCISSCLGLVLILRCSVFEKNILVGTVRELCAFGWKQMGEFCTRALPVVSNVGLWALGMLTLNRI